MWWDPIILLVCLAADISSSPINFDDFGAFLDTTLETTIKTTVTIAPDDRTTASTPKKPDGTTQAPVTEAPVDPFLLVKLLKVENVAGTLASGAACSKFAFTGAQCSFSLQFCIESGVNNNCTSYKDYGLISVESNSVLLKETKYNSNPNPINVPLDSYYEGFNIGVKLFNQDNVLIDQWTAQVSDPNKLQGVVTFTSDGTARKDMIGTSLQLAWLSNAGMPPTTTVQPTTLEVTTAEPTGTTVTPGPMPTDCEEVTTRVSGVYDIYPNGVDSVSVYCDFSTVSPDSGALTVIQSRDIDKNMNFSSDLEGYKVAFGTPDKTTNYWFGLDNMHILTNGNEYSLRIDLCCGSQLVGYQIYDEFKIDNSDNDYILTAKAQVSGIGLDYSNPALTPKKDIGAKFKTYSELKSNSSFIENCDILAYNNFDGTPVQPFTNSGGWWFGSCANNLNGEFNHGYDSTNCKITDPTSNPGLELRTNTKSTDEAYDTVSYSRVRMGVYRTSNPLSALPNFCA